MFLQVDIKAKNKETNPQPIKRKADDEITMGDELLYPNKALIPKVKHKKMKLNSDTSISVDLSSSKTPQEKKQQYRRATHDLSPSKTLIIDNLETTNSASYVHHKISMNNIIKISKHEDNVSDRETDLKHEDHVSDRKSDLKHEDNVSDRKSDLRHEDNVLESGAANALTDVENQISCTSEDNCIDTTNTGNSITHVA